MNRIYKGSISVGTDISGSIYGLSEIAYTINPDFSFELPKLSFETNLDMLSEGDIIIVADSDESYAQCSFYIDSIQYQYKSKLYQVECLHILEKLSLIKCKDIPTPLYGSSFGNDWCDSTPTGNSGYNLYNNQAGYYQDQNVWERRYFQVLFLMKMLIRKASGASISVIDSSAVDNSNSFYYTRYYATGSWYTTTWKYKELGVALESIKRLSSSRYDDYLSTDFYVTDKLPNCLQLLRWLCMELCVAIDIFLDSYAIQTPVSSSAPADSDVSDRQDVAFQKYRNIGYKEKTLNEIASPEWDLSYGYYDVNTVFVPYTWGDDVDTPDRTLVERSASDDDTGVPKPNSLSVGFPDLLRVYRISINTNNYYRSSIGRIKNDQTGLDSISMLMGNVWTIWSGMSTQITFETTLKLMESNGWKTSINTDKRKLKYVRIV